MEQAEIQSLRDIPIESVAQRLGLTITKHKTLCPYHEDRHPSLSFNLRTNTFKCFVCGAHGGTIDLAMHMLHKPFLEACRWLADENNITCTDPGRSIIERYPPAVKQIKRYPPDVEFLSGLVARPFLNEPAKQFLFEQRKLNPRIIDWLGISSISQPAPCWRYGKPFYDAPSLLFPYKDINGKVLNVQSRYLGASPSSGNEERIPRFRFPSNSDIHIFNLPILKYLCPLEPLYISEGITDCMALMSAGHKAIAIPSATLLKPEDLNILSSLKSHLGTPLHIYPDADEPGQKLYQKLLTISTSLGLCLVRHQLDEGYKDYSEMYRAQLTMNNA